MKKFIFAFFLISVVGFHYYKLHQTEKRTALAILDGLRTMELEVTADEVDEAGDKIYFSPRKYARRTAIMDCETFIYEKYRLWK